MRVAAGCYPRLVVIGLTIMSAFSRRARATACPRSLFSSLAKRRCSAYGAEFPSRAPSGRPCPNLANANMESGKMSSMTLILSLLSRC